MPQLAQGTIAADAEPRSVPAAYLDNLSARMRPGGLLVALLRPDGSPEYVDALAPAFFHKYVLPLLGSADPGAVALRQDVAAINVSGGTCVWEPLPGVIVAAFPHVERRELVGVVLLAAKSACFRLGEDVVRACGQLGLDGIWLNQQADELPAFTEPMIQRHARLLLGMLRDQVRLGALEHELDALSGQLANTYEELSLIYQISGGMRINRRPAEFFKQACLDVLEVIGVRGIGVCLPCGCNPDAHTVIYGALSLPSELTGRLGDELLRVLVERKSAAMINDLAQDQRFAWLAPFAGRMIAVPLQRQDKILGCLFGLDKLGGEFDSVDLKLLSAIANESAIYLENARLFEDVHDLMMGMLHSLTSAVDAKDAYTCGHSERVALLSRTLAKQAGMGDAEVERIYMAGLLHDVGKIGVPESVLQKTGRLTVEEFEQMKKHPRIGARILRDIKQVQDIIPGVLYHHERYDGKGYPTNLAGEQIPLMGRVICLADCFDAMTSNRTYRKALPLEVALAEIRRCAGTQFDPRLAECFLEVGADRFRELLAEQERKSSQLVDLQQSLRALEAQG
ncbi:MAG: HD domain-containing protein [Phycisphaeraceae bacterium]|nr:HD domain-containing protein [Phycisphaeraceae bacterium]